MLLLCRPLGPRTIPRPRSGGPGNGGRTRLRLRIWQDSHLWRGAAGLGIGRRPSFAGCVPCSFGRRDGWRIGGPEIGRPTHRARGGQSGGNPKDKRPASQPSTKRWGGVALDICHVGRKRIVAAHPWRDASRRNTLCGVFFSDSDPQRNTLIRGHRRLGKRRWEDPVQRRSEAAMARWAELDAGFIAKLLRRHTHGRTWQRQIVHASPLK